MEDYKFHSNDIISTLEDLQNKFKTTRNSLDADEVESVRVFDVLMQEKTHLKKMKTKFLEHSQKKKSETTDEIAVASEGLSTVEATLLEEKKYTNQLSKMCSDKAKTWDQRTNLRTAELASLTEAIQNIEGMVLTNTTQNTIRFVQQATNLRVATAVAASDGAMAAIEQAAEEAEEAPAFVQEEYKQHGRLRASRPHAILATDRRDTAAKVLRSSGEQLKSTLLTALASKIAADPLAKVKQLIQELIERLLREASNEANQKGWCDKSIADAKQKREYAAEEIADLNSQLESLEANIGELSEEMRKLKAESAELTKAQSQAHAERNAEKLQNDETINEAEQGLAGLNMVIDMLDKFYKTAKKEEVNLALVQGPEDDAPDAGFKNGEAYTGAQSAAGGILAMLDVMKSDFKRTISETKAAEAQAERDYLDFTTETQSSIQENDEAWKSKNSQREDARGKKGDAWSSLSHQQTILTTSINELKELKPVCIDTGMSYTERVERRQDEIEALNKALSIFENYDEKL